MPDVLAEFCTESLACVSERRLMVCISGLKRVLNKAYIHVVVSADLLSSVVTVAC